MNNIFKIILHRNSHLISKEFSILAMCRQVDKTVRLADSGEEQLYSMKGQSAVRQSTHIWNSPKL